MFCSISVSVCGACACGMGTCEHVRGCVRVCVKYCNVLEEQVMDTAFYTTKVIHLPFFVESLSRSCTTAGCILMKVFNFGFLLKYAGRIGNTIYRLRSRLFTVAVKNHITF